MGGARIWFTGSCRCTRAGSIQCIGIDLLGTHHKFVLLRPRALSSPFVFVGRFRRNQLQGCAFTYLTTDPEHEHIANIICSHLRLLRSGRVLLYGDRSGNSSMATDIRETSKAQMSKSASWTRCVATSSHRDDSSSDQDDRGNKFHRIQGSC